MRTSLLYALIHILVLASLISLFFKKNFLKNPMPLIIFFNSLSILATFYSIKLGNKYEIFQYALIGQSFILFTFIIYIIMLKKKDVRE